MNICVCALGLNTLYICRHTKVLTDKEYINDIVCL